MGAAASSLPEKLSHDDLKKICGDKFDEHVYRSLADDHGFVSREQFLDVAANGQEKEILEFFKSFCPHGEMDSRTFVKLCKDTKLMNKKNFSATDCDLIFQKAKAHYKITQKTLNYNIFRNYLVPEIATKKGVELDKLLTKLAHSEGPLMHGVTHAEKNKFHDDQSLYTGSHAQGGPSFTPNGGAVQMENLLDRKEGDVRGRAIEPTQDITDEHHEAALKLQNIQRKKIAQKKVEALKEIKAEISTVDESHFDTPQDGNPLEQIVNDTFMKFCPNGEMDSRTFIKLCKDVHLINQKFTVGDADLIFQKTKAKASAPTSGAYSSGVVHGKRVNFSVFRAVAIPIIAEKKNVKIEKVLEIIGNCAGPSLTGVTKTDNVKFHDDQSMYTGAHAQGGPSFTPNGAAVQMENLLDRKEADVRGVK